MVTYSSKISRKQSTPRSKATSRPRGIRKVTSQTSPRRSLRLLAAQTISGTTNLQRHNTSKKRNYDLVDEALPALPAKKQKLDPIEHWRKQGSWPKELFETNTMPTLDFDDNLLARSVSRKRSIGGSSTSARDLNREEKAAPYEHLRYEQILQISGVFMKEDQLGPNKKAIKDCKDLFNKEVELPPNTGFADNLFEQTFIDCHGKNEVRIIRDIGLLVCPSAEDLFKRRTITTRYLCESVDESWKLSSPITSTPPQPDFSVGFAREAFTEEQLAKIRLVLGNSVDQASVFRATWYMYFPFLGCEAKKGDGGLDIADRQNAHSMAMAVRAVVGLFRLASRAKELDGQILAFSISYNDVCVRIYGYYPRIQGEESKCYRYRIAHVVLQDSESENRWKTYKFVRNIYEHWASKHLKRLQSILTKIDTVVAAPSETTGISQIFSSSSISRMPSAESLRATPDTAASSHDALDDRTTTSKRRGRGRGR